MRWKTVLKKGLIACLSLCLNLPTASCFAYSPYSTEELDQLEQEFIQLINQSNSVMRDPLGALYLNRIAKRLLASEPHFKTRFFIVKSNEINAFAGPGGYIGVNSQLILTTENESELAAVMAHELAHVRQHHLYELIQHEKQMRVPLLASILASVALGAINPGLGAGAMLASMGGAAQDSINFTRSNEKEADRIGIAMLMKAGFDPQSMAGFFKKMQLQSRYSYSASTIPAILRSHPLDEERIAEAQNRSMGQEGSRQGSSLEYSLVKELVRAEVAANSKSALDYYPKACLQHNSLSACQYGSALALIIANQFASARQQLAPLLQQDPNNLFYQMADTRALLGLKQYDKAISQLQKAYLAMPDNYPLMLAYAESLASANRHQESAQVLLKASRHFKHDLPVCLALAQEEALSKRKAYAYFLQANCDRMQGLQRSAMQQLKTALKLCNKDPYLKARIEAKIAEIKEFEKS